MTFDLWKSSGVKKFHTIRKPICNFLFSFRDIRLQNFQGLTLTFDLRRSSGIKKFQNHSKFHIWPPIRLLWTLTLYLVPFSIYSTSKFLRFDLDLRPSEVIWGGTILYHSQAHIWLPIWLLLTLSLYLVPFSRYSTSNFSRFDLDLWPLEVNWGQIFLYHLQAHVWLHICLLLTLSLYLIPFSRYSISNFSGFDLDLWPCNFRSQLRSDIFYNIRKLIYDFLFDFYWHFLSNSYRFRDIRLQTFRGLTLTLDL